MDTEIKTLGTSEFRSPLNLSTTYGDDIANFVSDDDRIIYDLKPVKDPASKQVLLERAGPRKDLFFDPVETNAAIVTCGGLCPGLNDVIKSIVRVLTNQYRINAVYGIKYGFRGMVRHPFIKLDNDYVDSIDDDGGSVLGTSRGPQKPSEMVDRLVDENINILFCIGGDGTLKGTLDIQEEVERRGLSISVIGIPKTIDNDVMHIDKSFGFETAYSVAAESVRSAHVEASCHYNGVGIVKLMGRDSGFIAAYAALASGCANFVLIPEAEFSLEGKKGLLESLRKRLQKKHHAVIIVAEGAGINLMDEKEGQDASGNKLYNDAGLFIKDTIGNFLKENEIDSTVKYIDPSYTIRSAPANPADSVYCLSLGQSAAHAGMAGKTAMVTCSRHNRIVHLPIKEVVAGKNLIDPESSIWLRVLESTRQPVSMLSK